MGTGERPRGPVVFRCDAGPRLGIGHVMRCLALAEEFLVRGHRVELVADLDSVPWARDQVERRGVGHRPPCKDDVAGILALRPALVVIDSYVLPAEVYAGVRARVGVLALVDGRPGERPADLLLDQNIGAEQDRWPVPDGTERLAGLRYALMRADVRALRPEAPERTEDDPLSLLAFFGGTDATGAAAPITALLAASGVPMRARVVAVDDDVADACRRVRPGAGQTIDVVPPSDRIAADVAAADVVVSAAGTSSWELLCLGAATGLVCVADNQRVSYERAVGAGLTVGLGDRAGLDTQGGAVADGLTRLLTDPDLRAGLRVRGWRAVDGAGVSRVAEACGSLIG